MRSLPRLALALAFPAVLVAAACGGSSSGDTSAAATEQADPRDEALKNGAHLICTVGAQCSPLLLQAIVGGDEAACEKREYESLLPAWQSPGTAFTVDQLNACVAALTTCDGIYADTQHGIIPDACEVPGTLDDGATCTYFAQCKSLNCDHGDPWTPCGKCAPRVQAGGKCDGREIMCDHGLGCQGGTCKVLGHEGDACADDAPCVAWLTCANGTCGPQAGEGAPCKHLTGDCDLFGQSLVCMSGKCTAVGWANEGEDCGAVHGQMLLCAGFTSCQPSILGGTCMPRAKQGEACDPDNGPSCELHATCYEGKCEPVVGATCP